MSDEIRLQTRCVKNPSYPLDWVPIVGKIRMNRLTTERNMVKKLACFGWHFDGFSSQYTGTEYRVYGNTVTAHDNHTSYLRFCRPEYYYGNKFFKVLEWMFFNTLGLFRICKWLWIVGLILGGVLLGGQMIGAGVAVMVAPLAVLLFSNLCCFIGKKLNKKAKELTQIVLDGNGYATEWGDSAKDVLEVAKRIRKNRKY